MTAAAIQLLNKPDDVWVFQDSGLATSEQKLLSTLFRLGEWHRKAGAEHVELRKSLAVVGDKLHWSVRWVRRLLARLEAKGFVQREARFQQWRRHDGQVVRGLQQASVFRIVSPEAHELRRQAQSAAAFDVPVEPMPAEAPSPKVPPRRALYERLSRQHALKGARKASADERAYVAGLLAEMPISRAVRQAWVETLELVAVSPERWWLSARDELHQQMVRERHLDELRQWLIEQHGLPDVGLLDL